MGSNHHTFALAAADLKTNWHVDAPDTASESGLDTSTVAEDLPEEILDRQHLVSRSQAIAEIHFPPENASLAEYEMFRSLAQKRIIFDEFCHRAQIDFVCSPLKNQNDNNNKIKQKIECNQHNKETA